MFIEDICACTYFLAISHAWNIRQFVTFLKVIRCNYDKHETYPKTTYTESELKPLLDMIIIIENSIITISKNFISEKFSGYSFIRSEL